LGGRGQHRKRSLIVGGALGNQDALGLSDDLAIIERLDELGAELSGVGQGLVLLSRIAACRANSSKRRSAL
jgi:hypothetical protein